MQTRLDSFSSVWLRRNNLTCGAPKVKVMTFRPPSAPRPYNKINLIFENKVVSEVDMYRILGTLLTTNLNFDEHFTQAVKSGYQALKLIKSFTLNQRQPREETITSLYKTLVRTRIDSSVVACTNISPAALGKLQKLQRDSLITATQCKHQVSTEVLNHITNMLPIDLHLRLKSAEDLCRISSRNTGVIDKQLEAWMLEVDKSLVSTFQKMYSNYSYITKERFLLPYKVNLFHHDICPMVEINVIETRCSEVQEQIQKISEISKQFDYLVGTDGSTFPNEGSSLGRSGAAAVVWKNGKKIKTAVEHLVLSNNYEAELVGVNLGLRSVMEVAQPNESCLVLTDCISAIAASFGNTYINKDYNYVIQSSKLILRNLLTNNIKVSCMWVPGHKDVQINEEADELAKRAAQGSIKVNKVVIRDRKVHIINLREKVKNNWQFRVDELLSNHRIFEINNKVMQWKQHKNIMSHCMYIRMKQLISGHHDLNSSKSLITGESNQCTCGQVESFDHYLFLCEKYSRFRFNWGMKVSMVLDKSRESVRSIELGRLLGQDMSLSSEKNEQLLLAMLEYMQSTKRFR